MARLFILSGCNGSGKTTASYAILPELLEVSEFVNSDEFAKSLSPFNPSAASITASRLMLMKIRYLLDRRADFSIETTLATRSLLGIVKEAKTLGYTVTIMYLWLESPHLAMERVKARVAAGGHNISDEVVQRRYYSGLHYFFEQYAPICDRWVLADNSHPPFKVIAEGGHGTILVRNEEKYHTVLKMTSNER